MLAGNALCLILGTVWLSVLVGPENAIALGMLPFLAGGAVKSALGAALLKAIGR
jgi:biotin transport system substrate-specific component